MIPFLSGRDRPLSIRARLSGIAVAALLSEVAYLLVFLRPFPLLRYYGIDADMGGISGHSTLAFWRFVLGLLLLFVLAGGAAYLIDGLSPARALPWIFASGAVFALTLTFVYPVTAIDLYTYVDQSVILVHYHQNPIFVPPDHFPFDPRMRLSDSWANKGAPYGPLGILIDAFPVLVTGGNLLGSLVGLKLTFSLLALIDAALVYALLRRIAPRFALSGTLLVAWNPIVLFETSANGHNDVAMLLVALLGLVALAHDRLLLGLLLIGASGLVKYATFLILPLAASYALARLTGMRERLRLLAMAVLALLSLVVILYFPFWEGVDTFRRSLLENQLYIESFSSVITAFVPLRLDRAVLLGRVLFLPIYVYALWLARRSLADLLAASFLAFFGFLGLAVTNVKVWYAVWPSVMAAATPYKGIRLAALVLGLAISLTAALYGFVWVWLGLTVPGAYTRVNDISYALAFGPALALLFLLWHGPDSASPALTQPETSQRDGQQEREPAEELGGA